MASANALLNGLQGHSGCQGSTAGIDPRKGPLDTLALCQSSRGLLIWHSANTLFRFCHFKPKGRKEVICMQYTLSWHQQGDAAKRGHNHRNPKSIGNPDIDLKSNKRIIIVDKKIRQVYKELFQDSVKEFNARQRHKERKIGNYYSYIKNSEKHLVYEAIIQVGGLRDGWPDNSISALMNYAYSFMERNPNMYVVGAYIHADEAGAPHLHLDYIPFAECSRGMKVQNTLTGALKAQGFVSEDKKTRHNTAQIQWEQSERDAMRGICQMMGIDLYEQGIGRKRHFTVEEYKELQDQLNSLSQDVTDKQCDLMFLQEDIAEANKQLQQSKAQLQKLNKLNEQNKEVKSGLQATINKLKLQAAQYMNDIKALAADKKSAQTELQAVGKDLQATRDKLQVAHDELQSAQDKWLRWSEEHPDQDALLQSLKASFDILKTYGHEDLLKDVEAFKYIAGSDPAGWPDPDEYKIQDVIDYYRNQPEEYSYSDGNQYYEDAQYYEEPEL